MNHEHTTWLLKNRKAQIMKMSLKWSQSRVTILWQQIWISQPQSLFLIYEMSCAQTATLLGILSGDMYTYGNFFSSFLLLMVLLISASCFLNFSMAALTGFSMKCSSGYMPRYSCRNRTYKMLYKKMKKFCFNKCNK